MTTELAVPTHEPPSIDLFRQYQEQAATLLKTGFLPVHIKTAEQAVAIVLIGRELGIPMMLALRKVYVIQGTPCLAAELMLALAERTGQLDDCRIEHEGETCRVTIKRKGRKSAHTTEFSMADAIKLGLAGKDNWTKQPKVMRQWRAVSANLRVTFPDATGGLYSLEELAPEISVDERGNPTVPVAEIGIPDMMPRRKPVPASQSVVPEEPPSVRPTADDSRVEDARQPVASTDPDPWAEMRKVWEPIEPEAILESKPISALVEANPSSGAANSSNEMLRPGAVTFELSGQSITTAGITKETILKAFKLGALADELAGKGTAKNLLGTEYGLTSRNELTESQGKTYVTALTKIINAAQAEKRRG